MLEREMARYAISTPVFIPNEFEFETQEREGKGDGDFVFLMPKRNVHNVRFAKYIFRFPKRTRTFAFTKRTYLMYFDITPHPV